MAKTKKRKRRFLLGATIGAIGGLLLAPKSGKALRKDLKTTAEKISDKLMEIRDEVVTNTNKLKAEASKVANTKEAKALVAHGEKLAERLGNQAKHFQKYGHSVKSSVVKDTRELVHESSATLKKLQAKASKLTTKSVKDTKKAVKAVTKTVKKSVPKKRRPATRKKRK